MLVENSLPLVLKGV